MIDEEHLDEAVLSLMEASKYLAHKIEFAGCAIAGAIDRLANVLAESTRSDHPLQGETFEGLTEALNAIALAIGDHGAKE